MRSLVLGWAVAIPRSTARPAAVPPVRIADFRRNSRRASIPPSSCSARLLRRGSVGMGRPLVARQLAVDAPVRLLDVLEDDLDLVGGRLADLHHRLGDRGGDLSFLLIGASCVPLDRDIWHGLLLDVSARLGRRRRCVAAIIAAGRPPGKAAPPLGNSHAPRLSNSDDRTTSAAGSRPGG